MDSAGKPRFVKGQLMWLKDAEYDRAVARLDHLEGYRGRDAGTDNYYRRELRVVQCGTDPEKTRPVLAWVYYYCAVRDLAGSVVIESGEWT